MNTVTMHQYQPNDPSRGKRAPYNPNPAYADGRMLSTYDVENMLITFMAAISGMLILFLIVIIMIRVHYKARAEEIVHEMETQHQTRKQKTPSPFAVPPRRELEEEEDYVPVGKVRDGQHALYWRGDQVAAIVHHAALAPVIPSFEPVEGNVEIADYRRIR
ncbi:hypothetical protein Q1695_005702 [Nippostrongylus brasiliensis]|nr:hypothetical protein Q1695_005702 [Nippostrongylus brasiliensis]